MPSEEPPLFLPFSATSKTFTAQQRRLCLAKQDMKDFTPLYIYRWMGWNTEEAELRKRLRQSLQSKPSDLRSRAHNVREPSSIREQVRHTLGSGHTPAGHWCPKIQVSAHRQQRGLAPVPLRAEVPTILASTSPIICRRRAPKLYNNAWLIVWLPSPTSPLLPWEEGSRVCVLVDL